MGCRATERLRSEDYETAQFYRRHPTGGPFGTLTVALLDEVDALRAELAANAAMLARQCDLAREAETQLAEARRQLRRMVNSPRLWSLLDELTELRDELDEARTLLSQPTDESTRGEEA